MLNETAQQSTCNFPENKQTIFEVYFIVFGVLSIVYYAIFFFIFYARWKWPEIISGQFRLIYYLSISDFFFATQIFITPSWKDIQQQSNLCKAQAFFSSATTYSSTIWTLIIIWILYKTTVKRESRRTVFSRKFNVWSLVLGYGFPTLIAIIPLFFEKVYGNSGLWCWVRLQCLNENDNVPQSSKTLQLLFFGLQYGIFWAITVLSLILFCFVWTWMEKHALQDEKKFIQLLSLFPLFLFIYVFTASINRIYNYLTNHAFFPGMAIFHVAVSYIQKLFVSMIFGINPTVRNRICNNFCCCCRCKKYKSSLSEETQYRQYQNLNMNSPFARDRLG